MAVLVDCDNVPTDIVEHALRMVAGFGANSRKENPAEAGFKG
ncbi:MULTISPECIES: hypothetical protein [Xanthomonas]|nr:MULTISPECIES: hypothetical protein [Xanthomonas]